MRRLAPVFAALLTALAVAPTPAEAGRPGPSISFPADFELTACWGSSSFDPGCPWLDITMYSDGTLDQTALHFPGLGVLEYTFPGTWDLQRGGKRLVIEFLDTTGTTTYTGTRVGGGCYAGTMEIDNPNAAPGSIDSGVWEGCLQ